MPQILSATPIAPSILRWNYARYQVLARRGPHGGLWSSAASSLAEWGIFSLAFAMVALLFFGSPPERARIDAQAAAAHGSSFPSDHLAFGGAVVAALLVNRHRVVGWTSLLTFLLLERVAPPS